MQVKRSYTLDISAVRTSENHRGHSAAVRFDAGMGGRVENGEWQILFPDSARDPRDVARARNRSAAATEAAVDAVAALAGPAMTSQVVDASTLNEEYPALAPSVPSGAALWCVGRPGSRSRAEDFPELPSSAPQSAASVPNVENSRTGLQPSAFGQWGKLVKTSKKLSVHRPKAAQSFREAADPAPSLAVAMHWYVVCFCVLLNIYLDIFLPSSYA